MKKILAILLISCLSVGCSTDDSNAVPRDLRAHDFVWKGLNLYYLWQENVPDLGDRRFANQSQLNTYLRSSGAPSDLFTNLLYQRGTTDRFSVIYDDYTVLEQVLSGNNKNNGVDYALFRKSSGSDQVIGWVRYILPNSDASDKNIQRGDLFYAVNGTSLTVQNYQELLAANNYTLHMADYDNGNYTPNNVTVNLTKHDYSENPVYYTNVYEIGSHKIGYLVYNGFYGAYDTHLNNAFANFQAQGVNQLVLDLRYNSGGLVSTATHLASMITGQFTGDVFAKQQWNAKATQQIIRTSGEESLINRFSDRLSNGNQLNHLNLNKVYILTTASTASASELVINGLKPHIQVVQIGGKTTGKNVGSITLYDSPNYGRDNKNPDHKYAMQPLVLKIANSTGFGDYQTGLMPDIELSESLGDMKPLGDSEELFLATAIGDITGTVPRHQIEVIAHDQISDSKKMMPLGTEMYLDEIPEGLFDVIRE
jgi:carboxyl-terminal processing protease